MTNKEALEIAIECIKYTVDGMDFDWSFNEIKETIKILEEMKESNEPAS